MGIGIANRISEVNYQKGNINIRREIYYQK